MAPAGGSSRGRSRPCSACAGQVVLLGECSACSGTGVASRKCRDCHTWKPSGEFLRGGRLLAVCGVCRERRGERREISIVDEVEDAPLVARLSMGSRNRKTGSIPVSMTSRRTCPPSCPWRGRGCYAEQDFVAMHWRRLSGRGLQWSAFCERVGDLPAGQLWRHNEAGDLPGDGDVVDVDLLLELVEASRHTVGFTYTHKPVLGEGEVAEHNRECLREARERGAGGLVVNLSADGLEHADQLLDLGLDPVVAVVPSVGAAGARTPGGRRVVACPALLDSRVTCSRCRLCAREDRETVVAFSAHGNLRGRVSEKLSQLRLF